jgi:hypothetical protein
MAFTATQLNAATRAAYNNDKPILLGNNALDTVFSSSPFGWRSYAPAYRPFGHYGGVPSLYANDTTYPPTRTFDRFTYLRTRALLPAPMTSTADWSFLFKAADIATAPLEFDSVAIVNHNFGTLSKQFGTYASGSPFIVRIGVSDSGEFGGGGGWTEIASFTDPLTDKPLVSFDLKNGSGAPTSFAQFSGVAYGGISIECAGTTMGTSATTLPEIGEVIFGKRMQLLHGPTIPYNDRNTGADLGGGRAVGGTGIASSFLRSAGRRSIQATYTLTTDRADMLSFYQNDISQGQKQFLYVPRGSRAEFPSTYAGAEPGEAFWVSLQESGYQLAVGETYLSTTLELDMLESAPYNTGMV